MILSAWRGLVCRRIDRLALTKPEIAIEEIDRVIASGARFGCVLADSGYGSSGPFRQALSERGLLWAVGLSRRQNVYPADVALIFPVAKTGKRRKYHIPDQPAGLCRGDVGRREMAKGQLAAGHQRSADLSLRGPPCPRCGWP